MKLVRIILSVFKGIYDILASYLLAWIIFFALLAWGLQALTTWLVVMYGHESTEAFWLWIDRTQPLGQIPSLYLRLAGFLLLHGVLFVVFRKRIIAIKNRVEGVVDTILTWYKKIATQHPLFRGVTSFLFSLVVTLLLVPFVVQPTLVPLGWGGQVWLQRAANLADGSASAAIVESVIGLYRRYYAEPVVAQGVSGDDFDIHIPETKPGFPAPVRPAGKRPLMDRWDPYIRRIASNADQFALIKSLILTESGGLQYAVSHTGCAGLTQFCSRTARAGGFRKIFGVGQIYPCRCNGPCRVSRAVRRDLESGEPRRIASRKGDFPCELTDARFDPNKAIRAGKAFVMRLHRAYGGNIYLIYIGYNSGPGVANRVWKNLNRDHKASLTQIEALLPDAMRPYFKASSDARARSLVRVHLPKIKRAYDGYYAQGRTYYSRGKRPTSRKTPPAGPRSRAGQGRSRPRPKTGK